MVIMVVNILEVVGSQRRRHSQPATDRPVQGTTPSRRRVTPDRPIGGGKGGRRLCGRVPGNAVFLKQDRRKSAREQRRPNQDHQTPENRPRTATPPRKPEPKKRPSANDGEKKKKQARERNLGVGVGEDVWIDVGERVQVEETQGETQTKKVWVSPAPGRERQRETRRRRKHQTRKEEDKQVETKHGSGREGLKGTENKHRPLRTNNGCTKDRQRPEDPKTKTRQQPHQHPRGIHTAGWMGPWAALPSLGESPQGTMVPRGPKTPPPW